MTDKEKILEKIHNEMDGLMDAQGNFEYAEHEGAYHALCNLEAYIDSLPEEPASEDLEEEAENYASGYKQVGYDEDHILSVQDAFIDGAKWQKEQMMKASEPAEVGYWLQRGLSIHFDKSLERLGFEEGDKVKVIIVKED